MERQELNWLENTAINASYPRHEHEGVKFRVQGLGFRVVEVRGCRL